MLKWEIVDAYLGLPYRNYDGYIFQQAMKGKERSDSLVAAWRDSVLMDIKSDFKMTELTRKYENEIYGYAEITLQENFLVLSLEHHSKLKGKLEYVGNNRFLCTYSDPTYEIKVFPFDIENGKVKSFDLYVDNFIKSIPLSFLIYRFRKLSESIYIRLTVSCVR